MTFEAAQIEIAALSLQAAKYAAAAERASQRSDEGISFAQRAQANTDAAHYRKCAARFAARANALVDAVECAA